jgi:PPK2 family polyphosphate:nucleotide phosphotransferase
MPSKLPQGRPSIRRLLAVTGPVDLSGIDPRKVVAGPKDKDVARTEVLALAPVVADRQEMLWAEAKGGSRRRVVVVLQGMDTSGKGGSAKLIDRLIDPAGLAIASFGKPTPQEKRHHFLWRIEKALPRPGTVTVFDRSHYEDVLVVRVHNLVRESVWRGRYDEINEWEQRLVDDGVTFLKVMLHISHGEQKQRLLERIDDPTKHWKVNPGDVDERSRWDDYRAAYEEMLTRCSTPAAPWYVVPADRKWHRDWLLASLVDETLREMEPPPAYPPATFDVAHERARIEAS